MAARKRQEPLTEAVRSGDQHRALQALRDTLAAEIEAGATCRQCGGAAGSSTAALAKQLADVLKALAAMKPPEVSKSDDLAKRRAARRAQASKRAPSSNVSGGGSGRAR